MRAIQSGDVATLRSLVSGGMGEGELAAVINAPDEVVGVTPLMFCR